MKYRHDPQGGAFGEGAAAALDLPPERVFKTLVVQSAPGELAVAMVPALRRLDLRALAGLMGVKRMALADRSRAQTVTGYVVGGISPLGQKQRLPMALDRSACGCELVYVSAGRRGVELELAPRDLIALTGARIGPIAE